MKYPILTSCLLLSLWQNPSFGDSPSDVSFRYHAQWKTCAADRERLKKMYGKKRVSFNTQGQPSPKGLPRELVHRWKNLYEQCMKDGCYFCDADEGSCETGTCGPNNRDCKPYVGTDGLPKCGSECADYAFKATLT